MMTAPLDLRVAARLGRTGGRTGRVGAPLRTAQPLLSEGMREPICASCAARCSASTRSCSTMRGWRMRWIAAGRVERQTCCSSSSTIPGLRGCTPFSELVVRIDQTIEPESPATEADGAALVEQVERLLTRVGDRRRLSRGATSRRCSGSPRSSSRTPTSDVR